MARPLNREKRTALNYHSLWTDERRALACMKTRTSREPRVKAAREGMGIR